jgi:ribosomal protein S18 acetylase RimI-like enzyme
MLRDETLPSPASHLGWKNAAASGLTFRPIGDDDLPFLCRVYAATRVEELAPVPWTAAQKSAFLEMQFRAQHAHYQANYANALWLIIERDSVPFGRLYFVRWPQEHRLIDIAMLPEYRGQGIGTAILHDLFDDAADKPVTIHVEKNNPAMRLYTRLGFRAIGEHGVYDLLERRP